MTADYLTGRQNVVGAPKEELSGKLAALAEVFDLDWLAADGSHPLQTLWKRVDVLATNELLNFGDAVERLRDESADWLRGQADKVKTGDAGESAGAIFEILGLNLFSRDACRVIPAPKAMPGFDGTLVLPDGSRILVSIKNHGLSSRERSFLRDAKALDDEVQVDLRAHSLNGIELNVIAQRHLDDATFKTLTRHVMSCIAEMREPNPGRVTDWPYTITVRSLEPQFGPLSGAELSSGCRVMSPPHANEQANFNDAIRKGCENLHKQTKSETSGICRMIMLRLSNAASIARCKEWAACTSRNIRTIRSM